MTDQSDLPTAGFQRHLTADKLTQVVILTDPHTGGIMSVTVSHRRRLSDTWGPADLAVKQ